MSSLGPVSGPRSGARALGVQPPAEAKWAPGETATRKVQVWAQGVVAVS